MKIHEIHLIPHNNYDGAYKVVAHIDNFPVVNREPIANIDGETFWYGETNDGAVAFGVSSDEPWMGHKPGYMWSSRPSVFNGYFDKMCIEVSYEQYGRNSRLWGAMTVQKLFEHLTDKYEIASFKDEEGEIMYLVFLRGTVPNNIDDWELLETFVPTVSSGGIVVREFYEVRFTDAYGREHGRISGELGSRHDAVEFIAWQVEELTKVSEWIYRDGFDIYEIVPCIDF